MMRAARKVMALLLALCMISSMFVGTAFAVSPSDSISSSKKAKAELSKAGKRALLDEDNAKGYITKSGKPGCIIITPKDATLGEQYAATELQKQIKEISGAEILQVGEDSYTPNLGPYISIGRTELSKGYIDDEQFIAFGDEGYKVFSQEGNLIILGGRKRGSLYAVYQLLESLGVRWYSPDYTVMPKQDSIKIPEEPFEYSPKFSYRDQYWNNGATGEWLARMRVNGQNASVPDELGGSAHILYGCHSFWQQIPSNEFYTTHPEWFAIKEDGKRSVNEYNLTDQSLRDYMLNKVIAEVKATNGWAEYIWISQNDNSLSGGCFCDVCTAERLAHGGEDKWAANTISFVNYIAEGLAKEFPKVKIKTLAYMYTTEVPENMKVADNVIVELCGNFMPGDQDPQTILSKSWFQIAKNVEVYTYGGSNYGYWWPFPNVWEMGAQYSRALDAGINSFYMQGTAIGKGSGLADLRAYLSGKLAWDSTLDVKEETKDFCKGFYGPGGEYVYEYISWYSDYVEQQKMKLAWLNGVWCYDDQWQDWVNKEAMDYSDALFQKALEAVKDNPTYTNHVRRAYLEVLWGNVMVTCLNNKPEVINGNYGLISADNANNVLEKVKLFNEIMKENSYNMMSEPVGYVAGKSQLDLVSANFPAVEMSNGSSKLSIVPSLGGRVVIWNVDTLDGNIFKYCGGSDFNSAGYEELSGGLPVKTTKYEVVTASATSVVMKGAVTDNVESTRSFELDPTKDLLKIVSEYKNVSEKPISFTIHTHPEFSFGLFGKSSLYTIENEGKWTTKPLWTAVKPEGDNYVDPITVSKGLWMLGDTEKNIGLINKFDLSVVNTMYTYYGESYGGINLELWSPQVTLQPGETWKLDHSYEVTKDLKSVLESNTIVAPDTIAAPAITGVTAPVIGATPVATTSTKEYTATIAWNGSPATFAASTPYTATITITPKTGYTLTGVAENFFTVAGAIATNTINAGVVTAVFPATDATKTPITAIAAISGIAKVRAELTAGVLAPVGATASYQWQKCATADGEYTDIAGATTNKYTPVPGDATKFIKVVATGTGSYSGTVTSVATGAVEATPVSIALNMPASASSEYNIFNKAINANDGIDSTNWCSALDADVNSWWEVDLGSSKILSSIKIQYAKIDDGNCHFAPNSVTVQTSTDNVNWTTALSKSANVPVNGLPYDQSFYTYSISGSGRYVRLLFEDGATESYGKAVELAEVEVYCSMTPITAIAAISGIAKVRAELTAGVLTPAGATASYQWQICTTADGEYSDIAGATTNKYTPVTGDATKFIKVVAIGTGSYSGTVTSVATGAVETAAVSIALNMPVSASSEYDGNNTANNANDGINTSNWCSALNADVNSWWEVDLGSSKILSSVKVQYAKIDDGNCHFAPNSVTVQTSTDNVNWTTALSKSTNVPVNGLPYDQSFYTYSISGSGRYVRLLFEDGATESYGKAVEFAEVEVY